MPAKHLASFKLVAGLIAAILLAAPAIAATVGRYTTPDAAAAALHTAVQSGKQAAMLQVLGSQARPLIDSGDPVADRYSREQFTTAYQAHHDIEHDTGDRATLVVGDNRWPFPIPLRKLKGQWQFDAAAGREELINRRIGQNENATIQAALAYVDAQQEYFGRDPERTGLLHFAQRLVSTPGKRDGLYWPTGETDEASPLGPLFADAAQHGYGKKVSQARSPYYGYYYRILSAQGPNAKGGAYDYMAKGKMLGGFALVAWPAKYGVSGVLTFIVNQDGTVFEKNLGSDTASLAAKMARYDPDSSWKPAP
ncbi:DUF2950 domain-containing protein [Jeongeupia naejangsanensis]|uniref:DUF2950 domain-containing protein n=1 Tax=Jeongeupia naejangsanensis TaxID=613195 RepID=A0ABS2BKI3_9NEIS|nr:DUF2950 domain-containing protein [Jeongeupia naejangsanensis]MBM3116098.1 DUF2950 domain-containing protein [Jeongeupia naejangsanensis]